MPIKKSIRKNYTHAKKGFTLLETLLSVALLLILTMIVYQGFVSTLKLAANTANYQKSADYGNTDANLVLGNHAPVAGVSDTLVFTPPVTSGVTVKKFKADVFAVEPPQPVVMDAEDTLGLNTTHRQAFIYVDGV